jgi:CBS domain containing-hemolysin-like protein
LRLLFVVVCCLLFVVCFCDLFALVSFDKNKTDEKSNQSIVF